MGDAEVFLSNLKNLTKQLNTEDCALKFKNF